MIPERLVWQLRHHGLQLVQLLQGGRLLLVQPAGPQQPRVHEAARAGQRHNIYKGEADRCEYETTMQRRAQVRCTGRTATA